MFLAEEEADRVCLKALQCPDSFLVKKRLEATKDKLHWESIKWVFNTPQFQEGEGEDQVGLLWIKGGAGKGKTMMAIGIIEQLSRSASRPLIAYFFCQNADYKLNTLDSIIKGLILQLIKQKDDLKKCLRSRWDTDNGRFTKEISWRVLWDIFWEMLNQCTQSTIYIVIDALDECQDDGISEFMRLSFEMAYSIRESSNGS